MLDLRREQHVVLCGLDRLGVRTLEHLTAAGATVTVIADHRASTSAGVDVELVIGDPREPGILQTAGIEHAFALVLTSDDDIANLHTALTAREANPRIRTIVRLFNAELASQIEQLLPECRLLSSSALAAPAFVSAALGQLDAAETRRSARRARTAEMRATLRGLARHGGFRLLVGLLAFIIGVSALVFVEFRGLTPVDAIYFTVATATTTGYGDINLLDASWALKLYGTLLMLAGAATIGALYAFLTDALISTRLARALGEVPRGIRDHAIVAGVGSVGYRIVLQLVAAGAPVAAIEQDGQGRFVQATRALGVPVVLGDASLRQTLAAVHPARARCLLAVTDDDGANLQTALTARAMAPSITAVARLFDPDLAKRVEQALGVPSRSVSAIAGPVFAAAALDEAA